MGDGQLHVLFGPAERAEELVEPNLPYGLKAEPLSANLAGLVMFQRIRVDEVPSLCPARLHGLRHEVEAALLHQPRPIFVYLLAHSVAVAAQDIRPQLLVALMLILVGQAARYVADLLRRQAVDEADGQQDVGAGLAKGIAVRLFQPVVLLILARFRV